MPKKLTNEQTAGLAVVLVYATIILLVLVPVFTQKNGSWMIIWVMLLTEFPIAVFLHILTLALLGKEWLINPPPVMTLTFIVLGFIINSTLLYYCAYGIVVVINQIRDGFKGAGEKLP